jgi:integrase
MHSDGGGLFLRIKGTGKLWVVRFTDTGRKREMGIGSAATVTLADARIKATEVRELVASGHDPIAVRKAPVARSTPALTGGTTFRDAMDGYLALNAAAWTSQKHQKEWPQTLNTHAAALMGKQLADITMDDIEAVLVPIWTSAPARAKRVRERIEKVLGFAMAKKWMRGPNPAIWRGNLEHILPKLKPSQRHHAAVAVVDAPAAFQRLWHRRDTEVGYRALLFCILTGLRAGEVRGMTWMKCWTITP